MANYYNVVTGSRIANSAWSDQSGSDDNPVTGWTIGDDFILAVHMDDNSKDTLGGTYKLQWKKGAGGTFTDLAATGELNYTVGGATSLTDGNALTSGEGICSNKQGSGWTWVNGTEREDSNNTVAFDGSDEDETEHAWAIACDGATASETYYFQLVDTANGDRVDAIGVTITMAAGLTHYDLVCDGGTFSFSGSAAGLEKGYHIDCPGATYSYAGSAAGLEKGYHLDAGVGAFSYSGAVAGLLKDGKIVAAGATYPYAGSDVTMNKGRMMAADGATFAYAGSAVSFPRTYHIDALAGSFPYAGAIAALEKGYHIDAEAATFGYSGAVANLEYGRVIQALAATYGLSGSDAALLYHRLVGASPATFAFAGSDATLTHTQGEAPAEAVVLDTHGRLKRKRPRVVRIDEDKEIMEIIEYITRSGILD